MKLGTLESVGHNFADSLRSDIGLLIGLYDLDIYGEAEASPEGYIEVNFLTGTSSRGSASHSLVKALKLYRNELPRLCERDGVKITDFRGLTARFTGSGLLKASLLQ